MGCPGSLHAADVLRVLGARCPAGEASLVGRPAIWILPPSCAGGDSQLFSWDAGLASRPDVGAPATRFFFHGPLKMEISQWMDCGGCARAWMLFF